ncbi:MAG: DUF1127 domain-containing protein [Gammaproteobacteria bacterium]|nr:DUF1127 domain-containing protein [Gammaproteobacteria bacterium]
MREQTVSQNHVSLKVANLSQLVFSVWHHWRLNARTRRQLAQLTCQQLRDIGISCHDAVVEIQKPFWR